MKNIKKTFGVSLILSTLIFCNILILSQITYISFAEARSGGGNGGGGNGGGGNGGGGNGGGGNGGGGE